MRRNKSLTNSYHGKPCTVCGITCTTCAHHLRSKGANGPDEHWNLMALCIFHHHEIHLKGLVHMAEKYPEIEKALLSKGWEFCSFLGKWINSNSSY